MLKLADLQEFQRAANNVAFGKVFNVESGRWAAIHIEDDDVKVPTAMSTLLVRFGGVTSCPGFGAELEEIYRSLDLPLYKPLTPPSRLDTWEIGRAHV